MPNQKDELSILKLHGIDGQGNTVFNGVARPEQQRIVYRLLSDPYTVALLLAIGTGQYNDDSAIDAYLDLRDNVEHPRRHLATDASHLDQARIEFAEASGVTVDALELVAWALMQRGMIATTEAGW